MWPEGDQVGTEGQLVTLGCSGHILEPRHQNSDPSDRWRTDPEAALPPWGPGAQKSGVGGTPESWAHEVTAQATREP